jgi:drug/metabolite transporter (DMT)-like permease
MLSRKMAMIFRWRYIAAMKSREVTVARATLLIVLSAISFGSISVLTVLITGAGVALIPAMAWRYLIGALMLATVCDLKALVSLPRTKVIQLLLIGGCGQALITYVSLRALDYIAVGPLAFLFYTYPAWVALLAAVRKTERLTPVRVTALVMALLGVTIMVGAPMTGRLNPFGVFLALASALLYSAYLPALDHFQKGTPALLTTFLLIAGAAITFVGISLVTKRLSVPPDVSVWRNIVILALVSTVIAFSALLKGLSVLGSVRTSIIATVEPFFTAILGVIVLDNDLTVTTLIGGVLIGIAILTIEWSAPTQEATA